MVVRDMGLRLSPAALRAARIRAGLTQAQAAEAAGVIDRSIRNAEKGAHVPASDVVATLARLYGIRMESLFTHDDDGTPVAAGAGHSPHPDEAA